MATTSKGMERGRQGCGKQEAEMGDTFWNGRLSLEEHCQWTELLPGNTFNHS